MFLLIHVTSVHSLSPANKPQHNRPVILGTVPSYTTQQTCVPGYCTFIHNTTDLCSWVLYLHTQHNRPVFLGTVPSYTTQQTCVPGYCTFIHNTTDLCSWVLYLHTQHNRPVFLSTVPSYTTQQTCVPGYCTFIHNTTDLCSCTVPSYTTQQTCVPVLYLHTCVCPNCMKVDSCCRHFSASEFMGRGGGRNCGFTNV